jgi:hypothetical protein
LILETPLTEEQLALKTKLMDKLEKMLLTTPTSGCQSCALEFPDCKALYRHMWVAHQKKKLECELCHNMYGVRKHLIEHYTRVHFQTRKRRNNYSPRRTELETLIKKEDSPYSIKIENESILA